MARASRRIALAGEGEHGVRAGVHVTVDPARQVHPEEGRAGSGTG